MVTKILKCLLIFTLSFSAYSQKKADPVIATVNGIKIKKSEFLNEYAKAAKFVSSKGISKEHVLNTMIERILGIQKAKKAKLDKNPVVKYKMEDVLYHAQISKDLEPLLKKIVVTDKDVANYYKTKKEYRTAHILFRLPAIPTKKQEEAAVKLALQVYNDIKNKPSLFAELANKYSQANVAPNGGDIGYKPAVQLAPEYYKAIHGKNIDYVAPPIKTQFGYHIVKVLGVKKYKEISLPMYKKIIYDQKRDRILADYFVKLRQNATVKIDKKQLK